MLTQPNYAFTNLIATSSLLVFQNGANASQTFKGTVIANSFQGDGSGLTGLPAANLTGTLPQGTLSAGLVTNNATRLTLSGTFSGNGGGLTNLNPAPVPGSLTTNIPFNGATLYITNGVIMGYH